MFKTEQTRVLVVLSYTVFDQSSLTLLPLPSRVRNTYKGASPSLVIGGEDAENENNRVASTKAGKSRGHSRVSTMAISRAL